MKFHYTLFLLAAVVLLLLPADEAANCQLTELKACLSPITSGAAPSGECCGKLRGQQPCLCGYLRNQSLRQYLSNRNAKKVASTCGVSIPNC